MSKESRGRPSTISTGNPVGTYSRGEKHPSIDGKFFSCYVKSSGQKYEYWVDAEKLDEIRSKDRVKDKKPSRQTGSNRGFYSRGDKHPSISGLLLWCYRTDGRELWMKESTFAKARASAQRSASNRRARLSGCSNINCKTTYPMLCKFRDILNDKHGCGMFHVDHIVPLAIGGDHSDDNVQLATAKWNQQKGAKP